MDLTNNDHSTGSMGPPIGKMFEEKVSLLCNACKICYRAPKSQAEDNCEFCDSEDIHVISDAMAMQLVKEALAL